MTSLARQNRRRLALKRTRRMTAIQEANFLLAGGFVRT
jgi:hypothetical protein